MDDAASPYVIQRLGVMACSPEEFDAITAFWRNDLCRMPVGNLAAVVPVAQTADYLMAMPTQKALFEKFVHARLAGVDFMMVRQMGI